MVPRNGDPPEKTNAGTMLAEKYGLRKLGREKLNRFSEGFGNV